ncbi:MAG TPA: DUF1697 domain-containing protein [Sphingomicrobium sp.]
MTAFVALLRGVNLMGSTTIHMTDLKAIAEKLGLDNVGTYIASGNLLFTSRKREAVIKAALEGAVKSHMSRDVGVMVRTAKEMADVVASNPFSGKPGNKVVAIFFDAAPPTGAIEAATNIADERLALGRREIYVHYPSGQGRSKLNLRLRALGTARNMNTVAKLADLARELS